LPENMFNVLLVLSHQHYLLRYRDP